MPDSSLQVLLALLGGVILRIFAEVAEGGSLLEFSGDIEGQFVLEGVQLFLKLLLDLFRHRFGHYKPWRRGIGGLLRAQLGRGAGASY